MLPRPNKNKRRNTATSETEEPPRPSYAAPRHGFRVPAALERRRGCQDAQDHHQEGLEQAPAREAAPQDRAPASIWWYSYGQPIGFAAKARLSLDREGTRGYPTVHVWPAVRLCGKGAA